MKTRLILIVSVVLLAVAYGCGSEPAKTGTAKIQPIAKPWIAKPWPECLVSCDILGKGVYDGYRIVTARHPHIFFTADGRKHRIQYDGKVETDGDDFTLALLDYVEDAEYIKPWPQCFTACRIIGGGVFNGKVIVATNGPHMFITEDGRGWTISEDGTVTTDIAVYDVAPYLPKPTALPTRSS